jgi:tripartite ATP-independent transporter DctM subunit
MDGPFVCLIGFVLVVALLLARTPIGVALGIVGLGGLALVLSPEAAIIKSGVITWSTISHYELGVLPLFLFMAHVLFAAGVSTRLFDVAAKFVGHKPGGLALASIAGCAGFGTVSGSSLATAATMGLVALPEMRRAGYDSKLATGALAAGGTLGVLIPPSGALIVYGVIAEQSIGKLFTAAVLPGLTQALFYLVVVWLVCRRNPMLGPPGPRANWRARFTALGGIIDIVALVLFVLAGIMIGWLTPTEAAAVGSAGALVIAAFRRKLSMAMMREALRETLKTSGMLYLVIIGALIFSAFVSATDFAALVAGWIEGSAAGALGTVLIMTAILLVLGMFLDGMGIMLLTTPIFLPVAVQYGMSPIWFGIFLVRTIEMGFLTPPVGMNVYVIHGIARDIPVGTIFRGVVPFFIADLFHLAMLIAFPVVTLWLPSVIGG